MFDRPEPIRLIIIKRLIAKRVIDPLRKCWLFQGSLLPGGYGRMMDPATKRLAPSHSLSYEAFRGPIPEGFEPDHLCKVRRCFNPAHLELVTRQENLLRGDTIAAAKAAQTHCGSGHEFTEENIYRAKNGTRSCRICRAEKYRQWVETNRERRRELDREFLARRRAANE